MDKNLMSKSLGIVNDKLISISWTPNTMLGSYQGIKFTWSMEISIQSHYPLTTQESNMPTIYDFISMPTICLLLENHSHVLIFLLIKYSILSK